MGTFALASDFELLPAVDWPIDAAANPSVPAGIDGRISSRQLVEHNLFGTVNMLEFCRQRRAGFILLSTSRVAPSPNSRLQVEAPGDAFRLSGGQQVDGVSTEGVSEAFSTEPPVSLQRSNQAPLRAAGAWSTARHLIFRCVSTAAAQWAGAGPFGRADQGIFSH